MVQNNMNYTPIMLTHNIGMQNGGLTKAILHRANMFANNHNHVRIFTIGFHRNFEEIISEQYKRGLSSNVEVLNIYSDLDPKKDIPNALLVKKTNEQHFNDIGYIKHKDINSKGNAYRYFENGSYKMYKVFDNDNKIMVIDYFEEGWRRSKQEHYNEYGELIKTREMDLLVNKPRVDKYYSKDGECYLTINVDIKTGKNLSCFLHYPEPMFFKTFDDLVVYWVNNKLKDIENPSIICEKREYVSMFKKFNREGLKLYYVLHNNHFSHPFIKGSKIDPTCNDLINNLDIFSKVIVLTEEQKKDLIDDLGNHDKFEVIPHFAEKVEKKNVIINPHLAVTIARYEHQKALDQAIRAFKFVVDKIPTAQYHIYGYGKLEGDLKNLINQLGLEKNIFLFGFSKDPLLKLEEAACSVLTSDYEGFGLVITESLSVGTPVVSYKTKYGPQDIIRDNVDGFLVDKGDIETLGNKIRELMESSELRKEFSDNALDVLERFSYKKYEQQWISLLNR